MSWAAQYIGEPWVAGRNDCWAFARRVQAEVFAREVPAVDIDALDARACARAIAAHPERLRWSRVDAPAEGDLVLMAHAKHPSHVGVWVSADGGGVLHALQGAGVVFQTRAALALSGWGHLEYWRAA